MKYLKNYKKYMHCSGEELIELLNKNDIEDFISIIKMSGITLNPYDGGKEFNSLVKKLDEYIIDNKSKYTNKKWEEFLKESSIINKLYYAFYTNPTLMATKTENPVESFLIVTEQFLYYINNIISDNVEKNNELNLEFSKNFFIEGKYENQKEFFMDLHDCVTKFINNVLSSLLFFEYKKHKIDINKNIAYTEMDCTFNHFKNAQLFDIINYIVESWKFGGRIVNEDSQKIDFKIQENLDENYFLINERNESRLNKINLQLAQIIKEAHIKIPFGKAINEFINEYEFFTCKYLEEYLNSDNLRVCKCKLEENVITNIRELVRIYYVLVRISEKFIKSRKIRNNTLSEWGMIITEEDLLKELKKYDIKDANVSTVISALVYKKNVDIFDAPLISLTPKSYLILPNILINLDIVKIILSIVREIPDRGEMFENLIKDKLLENEIKSSPLYLKDGTEEYQCDVAFCIADDLYVAECKSFNQFKNIKGYYDFQIKLAEAKEQLERISNKFSKEISYVNKKLGFHREHKFKSIHKLIITLNMLGLDRKNDDTYYLDESCLIKFLDREKPSVTIFGDNYRKIEFNGFEEYEGKINNYKFELMLKSPCNIKLTRRNMEIKRISMEFNNIIFEYEMYLNKHKSTKIVK